MLWWQKIQLKIGSDQTRIRAIEKLGESKNPQAAEMLAQEALEQGSPEVLKAAAETLGKIGDARSLKTLALMLEYGKIEVQAAAAEAIRQIGAPESIPVLVKALKEMDTATRAAVSAALIQFGEQSVEPLIKTLEDLNRMTRKAAGETLQQLGAVAVPDLIKTLQKERGREDTLPAQIHEILVEIGPAGVESIVATLPELNDLGRRHVVEVLGRIDSEETTRALALLLHDDTGAIALAAARVLVKRGWSPDGAKDKAAFAVWSGDWEQAVEAGQASLPALFAALIYLDTGLWESAAKAIGQIGSAAAEPLTRLLDQKPDVRSRILYALGGIGDATVVSILARDLQNSDIDARESAVMALWHNGSDAAVDALLLALKDQDRLVRHRSALALGELKNPRAIDALVACAENDETTRPVAAAALAKISPPRALRFLTQLVRNPATADEASHVLARVMEEAAGDIPDDDLFSIVQLQETLGEHSTGLIKVADCSRSCALAQAELQSRQSK